MSGHACEVSVFFSSIRTFVGEANLVLLKRDTNSHVTLSLIHVS